MKFFDVLHGSLPAVTPWVRSPTVSLASSQKGKDTLPLQLKRAKQPWFLKERFLIFVTRFFCLLYQLLPFITNLFFFVLYSWVAVSHWGGLLCHEYFSFLSSFCLLACFIFFSRKIVKKRLITYYLNFHLKLSRFFFSWIIIHIFSSCLFWISTHYFLFKLPL